ncbi:hypothetical protein PRIPAC_81732 [Pristionchus pacificus]|nr:hypothetical protein PRIPAC_81732 [Pristionchus pacificus]
MAMECLICTDVITHARMGVNSCRACAAFYKSLCYWLALSKNCFRRTSGQFDRLKCKDGKNNCRAKNPKTTCRKCRLKRFKEVLARACDEPVSESYQTDTEKSSFENSKSFIDHSSLYDCQPSSSQTPLLDKIKRGYSLMCLIRKSGETALKVDARNDKDITKGDLILTPATYLTIFPNVRVGQSAVIEFGNLAFDEFRSLDESCKKMIIEKSYALINLLDSTYRVCHHFPEEAHMNLPGYTTYFRMSELETFFENCPDDIDKENLIKEVKSSHKDSSKIVRQLFETIKPTDFEFLSLFGLALWNDRIVDCDEKLLKFGSRIRSEIMRELHICYTTRGTVDYASRVGNIFCLLANSQNQSVKTTEDFQVFRLLNMYQSYFSESGFWSK